jgi:hypothetical protein
LISPSLANGPSCDKLAGHPGLLIVRAYWLAIALWVLVGVLFIGVLIPTHYYITAYQRAAEYAQQHYDSHGDFESPVTAAATIVIAIFTAVLAYVTEKQARLTKEALIAAHPPKLAVRYIHLTNGNGDIEAGFTVENIGGSDATVRQSMIGLYIYKAPLPCPPEYYKFGRKVLDGIKFSVGEVQSFTVSNDLPGPPWHDLHFIGWAQYVDASGSIRALRFCRQYQPETCRFIKVNDPEYEPNNNCP